MSSRNQSLPVTGRALLLAGLALATSAFGQEPVPPAAHPAAHRPVRPGVNTPGISRSMADIKKEAVITIPGSPDWSVVTADSLWVTTGRDSHIVQLVAATNTVGKGSIWLVAKPSTLVRIDPAKNAVIASIQLPSGSENPLFSDGFVWISSYEHNELLKVDPASASVVATIAIGPKPRFLTTGAGSIWTLNQGDGTISRVDEATGKLVATIACGIPGGGGEITFGAGHIWATMFDFPITEIDPADNKVVKQWGGPGGDGLRFGLGSLWLSNGRQGTVWRLSPNQP